MHGENYRCELSGGFAAVLAQGLTRRREARLGTADELASALHGCALRTFTAVSALTASDAML